LRRGVCDGTPKRIEMVEHVMSSGETGMTIDYCELREYQHI
jgi:hypothetical protein